MNKKDKYTEVVVIAYGRSAIARANKGALATCHPVDIAGQVLDGVLHKVPKLDRKEIYDVIVGCAKPEGVQGFNIARLIAMRAQIPYVACAQTVNRFCASGLQSIATGANMIRVGEAEIVVAGGVEKMSNIPMGAANTIRNCWVMKNEPGGYMPMGMTAENVAEKYNITAWQMEEFAISSHKKAHTAQQENKFAKEIIPLKILSAEGEPIIFSKDEGVRSNTSHASLAKLPCVFKENGRVTAGTASQMSDAASFIVLASMEKVKSLGIKPVARYLGYAVAGVDPSYMGIGPINAIPKVLKYTGLNMDDMDVIELNEAFAAQAIPCINELGINLDKVNINGGAIALGHPLGATGSILMCKAISELERINGKYALISMCIGGGMGAAGIIEYLP